MEDFYTNGGYMFPEYSVFYWFGLFTREATWPTFAWQDASFGKPNPLFNYTNWGLLTVPRADGNSDAYPEPNRCAGRGRQAPAGQLPGCRCGCGPGASSPPTWLLPGPAGRASA